MQNKLFIAILLFAIGLAGCKKPPLPVKKDDNSKTDTTDDNKPSAYVGDWSYSKIEMTNGNLILQGQSFGTFTGTGKDIVGSVSFAEKPNTFTATLEYTAALNLTVFGQTQQTDFPVAQRTLSGTWTESNGNISLKADDGTSINVISSTSSEIVFTGAFNEQVPLGQQFTLDASSDVKFTIVK